MELTGLVRTADKMLYQPPEDPVLVEVPPFEFVMIDGSGDPQTSPDYATAVAALYGISYPVVITLKRAGRPGLKAALLLRPARVVVPRMLRDADDEAGGRPGRRSATGL